MARNLNLMTEPASLQSSIPDILEEKRLRRRLFRIPADQRKLLEHPHSWATFQSNSSIPFLNIPPHVIENLKKCHARQFEEAQAEESESEEQVEPDELKISSHSPLHPPSDDINQDGREDSPAPSFQSQPNEESEPDDDDKSWSLSPEYKKHPPQRLDHKETSPEFVTQLPPVSSPRPTEPTRLTGLAAFKRQPLVFPSSNPEEEPLDIEVPTSIHDSISSVSKSAVPTFATPPSAQIVPCTFQLSEQTARQEEAISKQRKYKEVPELFRPEKNRPTPTHLNYSTVPHGHTDSPTTDVQSSLSTANTSSSIIPSTMPGEALSRGMIGSNIDPTTSPSKESRISHEESNVQISPQAPRHSPEYRPVSPTLGSSPLPLPIPQPRLAVEPSSGPNLDSQPPFVRYTVTYPNYNGTICDFVTACMYIQLQQRRIRTSLYDDFIRAWHEGYVPYVRECDDNDPPVKALNAIEWFNGIDDDPLFTSRVITKQNLQLTLDYYPEELRSAQSLLGLTPSQSKELTSTPDAALLVEKRKLTSKGDDDVIMDDEPSRTITTVPKPVIIESRPTNLEPSMSMQPPARNGVIPLHKSFGETERKRTAKVFARSNSDVTHQKRKASEESEGSVSKRLSVNSLSRSEVESNTSYDPDVLSECQSSIAPSSTAGSKKRKKKFDEAKFEKSMNRWKKKREMERITSSAPMSNTPTSAQRE